MGSEIRDFFDERASKWDEWADDDLERVRHLFGRISVKPGDRVLDCACGTGVVTGLLHEMSQKPVLGIDIAPKMIEIAKRKYEGHESIIFQTCDFLSLEEGSLTSWSSITPILTFWIRKHCLNNCQNAYAPKAGSLSYIPWVGNVLLLITSTCPPH